MTDIKLLPLPKWLLEGFTDPTIERLCDYTRANVEHYVKELQEEVARVRGLWGDAEILGHKLYDQNAAKDAEIEALRAEVAKRDGIDPWAVLLRAQEAEARAERLAEALQKLAAHVRPTCPVLWDEAQSALRDHDQEVGNG